MLNNRVRQDYDLDNLPVYHRANIQLNSVQFIRVINLIIYIATTYNNSFLHIPYSGRTNDYMQSGVQKQREKKIHTYNYSQFRFPS